MRQAWVLALLLPLAGCVGGPDIPSDAATDTDPALEGLKLSAWTNFENGRLRMHGIVENLGDASHDIRIQCGEPWTTYIEAPDGRHIEFFEIVEEVNCVSLWDVLRPGNDIEVLYSWDYREHDLFNNTHTELLGGTYTWFLAFETRTRDEKLAVSIPIEHPGGDPLKGFRMDVEHDGALGFTVHVENDGEGAPLAEMGCGREWHIRIETAAGDEVPQEPMHTCLGFRTVHLGPGWTNTTTLQWDGMMWNATSQQNEPAPPGDYRFVATFGLRLAGREPSITDSVEFTLQ